MALSHVYGTAILGGCLPPRFALLWVRQAVRGEVEMTPEEALKEIKRLTDAVDENTPRALWLTIKSVREVALKTLAEYPWSVRGAGQSAARSE
jgi:hypothetical protein